MVVCKFFLQGTCKFGEMCKFSHDLNEGFNTYQNYTGSSILRNSSFGGPQIPQPKTNSLNQDKSNVDTSTLVKSVVTDMTQAEKGGQWLFSCYAPFKEKPAFPGFEDQSFEEIRLGYYEAVKAGKIEQFKQQIQGLVQEVIVKVRSLQNPSPDIINMLVAIYNTPPSPQAGVFSGSMVSNASTTNFSFKSGTISQQPVFAQVSQRIFGNVQQSPQQQNVFAGTSGNNIFGGSSNQSTGNIFAGNNQNNIFGNQTNNFPTTTPQVPASSNSIFANKTNNFPTTTPQVPASSNSIFANQTNNFSTVTSQVPTSSNNIFAQANNNLGMQNSNSAFSGNQPSMGSIFSNNQTTSNVVFSQPNTIFQPVSQMPKMFVSPQTTVEHSNNIFNTPQLQQNSIFNQAPNQTNLIMNSPNTLSQPQAYSNSIFGSAQNNNSQFASNVQQPQFDELIYSKLENLTEEEIKWFESNDLDVLNIPEKPPTYQMCFKP